MLYTKKILAAVSLLFIGIIAVQGQPQKAIADKIIAVVGDRIILYSDVKNSLADISRQGGTLPDNAECLITEQAIVSKVLMLQAEKDSLPVSDEEVEAELDQRVRYYINQLGSKDILEEYAGKSVYQIKFSKTYIGIKDPTPTLRFVDLSDTTHFKRIKLVTAYLEAPIELRYTANPLNSDQSFKFAVGVKVGTMVSAHTRYKDLQDENGNSINDYVMKEASKRFFNTSRISATARIGWGHFSAFGSYQFSALFKDGVAAEIKPYSIGLTLSGL